MKNTNSSQIFEKILGVMDERSIKPSDFQSSFGLSGQQWNHWKNRGVPGKEIPKLAKFFDLNIEWLITGKGDKYKSHINVTGVLRLSHLTDSMWGNLDPHKEGFYDRERIVRVPMLMMENAWDWKNNVLLSNEAILIPELIVAEQLFGVRVIDDSMEPEFKPGDAIIVDTDMEAKHLSYVLAEVNGVVVFRQLFDDAGELLLRPLNVQFSAKPKNQSRIIGVIRQKIPKETVYC